METVIAALGANALVLGALAYLVKTLIGARLEKDLATFKGNVERKATEEIERFRAQLEKDRLRMQISYGGIFERQADAILALYGSLIVLERGATEAIHLISDREDRRRAFESPLWELHKTIIEKQILLPPEVDNAMEAFLNKLPRAVRTYIAVESRDLSTLTNEQMTTLFEQQDEAMKIIEKEIPKLRNQLVTEMRKVIGVVANEF